METQTTPSWRFSKSVFLIVTALLAITLFIVAASAPNEDIRAVIFSLVIFLVSAAFNHLDWRSVRSEIAVDTSVALTHAVRHVERTIDTREKKTLGEIERLRLQIGDLKKSYEEILEKQFEKQTKALGKIVARAPTGDD